MVRRGGHSKIYGRVIYSDILFLSICPIYFSVQIITLTIFVQLGTVGLFVTCLAHFQIYIMFVRIACLLLFLQSAFGKFNVSIVLMGEVLSHDIFFLVVNH